MCDICCAYYRDPTGCGFDDEAMAEHQEAQVHERCFYRKSIDLAKNNPESILHVSLDYAQNIGVPFSPMQANSLYFKSLAKVFLFGIVNEGNPSDKAVYLTSEANLVGKGSREVISFLHDYLSDKRQPSLILNMDNCGAQNKNNAMIWYLAYRVMAGLNEDIHVHFMIPGHTKFSPDALFGSLKFKLRREELDWIGDVEEAIAKHHKVKIHADSTSIYDWPSLFESSMQTIDHITSNQHFVIRTDDSGTVQVHGYKSAQDNPRELGPAGVTMSVLTRGHTKSHLISQLQSPEVMSSAMMKPLGLSEERKQYYSTALAPHCRAQNRAKYTFGV